MSSGSQPGDLKLFQSMTRFRAEVRPMDRKRIAVLAILCGAFLIGGCANPCRTPLLTRLSNRIRYGPTGNCCPTSCCPQTCCPTSFGSPVVTGVGFSGDPCCGSPLLGSTFFEGSLLTAHAGQSPACCADTLQGRSPLAPRRLIPQAEPPRIGGGQATPQPYRPQQ